MPNYKPSCWALCDCQRLIPIWTCSGYCLNCEETVWPRPGLTVHEQDCDCGHPLSHPIDGLCHATIEKSIVNLYHLENVVVSKPYAQPVPLKPIVLKPFIGQWANSYESDPVKKFNHIDAIDKWLAGLPPKQKKFDLEGGKTERYTMYTYQLSSDPAHPGAELTVAMSPESWAKVKSI